MDTNEKHYSHNGMREGDPGNINPRDNDHVSPAKNVSEIEKLEINESGSGVRDSHRQSEEFIADPVSQIDNGTKDMQSGETSEKQFDTSDFNRVDERDQGDSSEDWDAERSRTGRSK